MLGTSRNAATIACTRDTGYQSTGEALRPIFSGINTEAHKRPRGAACYGQGTACCRKLPSWKRNQHGKGRQGCRSAPNLTRHFVRPMTLHRKNPLRQPSAKAC